MFEIKLYFYKFYLYTFGGRVIAYSWSFTSIAVSTIYFHVSLCDINFPLFGTPMIKFLDF